VDDDKNCREYFGTILKGAGFDVVEAQDGVEGLATYRGSNDGFTLVLSDWSMPHMDGAELMRRVLRNNDKQRVLMFSSDPSFVRNVLKNYPPLNLVKVLDKAIDSKEFLSEVATALE
jgi:CheY-like chemotaxis protein